MKKLIYIVVLSLIMISCNELEVSKVEYTTTTMMGRTVLSVTQDSVIVDFNGRGTPTHFSRATKADEWVNLMLSLQEVDLNKIKDLEAPSEKRATDAAPFAQFNFVTKDSTYQSATFDHKNPNAVLMPTMQEILKITEENKK